MEDANQILCAQGMRLTFLGRRRRHSSKRAIRTYGKAR